jgi:endo-1,4-beta-D-glucanase Y
MTRCRKARRRLQRLGAGVPFWWQASAAIIPVARAQACGSLALPVPAMIMRRVHLVLVSLLAGLCLACQPDPSSARLTHVLTTSWQSYCRHFIRPDGQVAVPEEGGGAISEAQAYALLRAVWANDAPVFNRVYVWTYKNLSRVHTHGDSLLAWRWGRLPNGAWGVVDANSATDGDLDYALALVLAAQKGWRAPAGLPDYLPESRRVQAAILAKEVVALPNGELLLTPGNWHQTAPPYLVNPSYFSPAAYRLFARLNPSEKRTTPQTDSGTQPQSPSPLRGEGRGGGDKKLSPLSLTPAYPAKGNVQSDDKPVGALREPPPQPHGAAWPRLHHSTYTMLAQLSRGLEGASGVGLFPDWCRLDAAGRFTPAPGKDTRFGWEAVRLPFRVALDALWFKDPQAAQLLQTRFLPFFKAQWQAHGRLAAVYTYAGAPAADYESPVLYAGVLAGALAAADPGFARAMALKILSFYHEDRGRAYFETPDNYYANNWAWLGLALYAGWTVPF